jgi:hypothetical protein
LGIGFKVFAVTLDTFLRGCNFWSNGQLDSVNVCSHRGVYASFKV